MCSSNPKVQNKFFVENPKVQDSFTAECPEFRPTIEEFKNFSKYIESVEEKALPFGIMKIIPPAGNKIGDFRSIIFDTTNIPITGWKPREAPYDEADVSHYCLNWNLWTLSLSVFHGLDIFA